MTLVLKLMGIRVSLGSLPGASFVPGLEPDVGGGQDRNQSSVPMGLGSQVGRMRLPLMGDNWGVVRGSQLPGWNTRAPYLGELGLRWSVEDCICHGPCSVKLSD